MGKSRKEQEPTEVYNLRSSGGEDSKQVELQVKWQRRGKERLGGGFELSQLHVYIFNYMSTFSELSSLQRAVIFGL